MSLLLDLLSDKKLRRRTIVLNAPSSIKTKCTERVGPFLVTVLDKDFTLHFKAEQETRSNAVLSVVVGSDTFEVKTSSTRRVSATSISKKTSIYWQLDLPEDLYLELSCTCTGVDWYMYAQETKVDLSKVFEMDMSKEQKGLAQFLKEDQDFADVALVVAKNKIRAHAVVLAAHSELLLNMMSRTWKKPIRNRDGMLEITCQEFNGGFHHLLNIMYERRSDPVTIVEFVNLMQAASYYQAMRIMGTLLDGCIRDTEHDEWLHVSGMNFACMAVLHDHPSFINVAKYTDAEKALRSFHEDFIDAEEEEEEGEGEEEEEEEEEGEEDGEEEGEEDGEEEGEEEEDGEEGGLGL
jgi:BTB/POZ domain